MARGRFLSLEEARKQKRLDRFCKEHPSTGDRDRFDRLFEAMAHGEPPSSRGKAKASIRASYFLIVTNLSRPAERVTKFYNGSASAPCYFADPDGHVWEVAWNPGFTITGDGATLLQD